jgi:hypothetical protein
MLRQPRQPRSAVSIAAATEETMLKLLPTLALGAMIVATPAAAHHIEYLDTPFASRGQCEAMTHQLSNEDDFLIDQFPDLFSSEGEVRSFLNRAFKCEYNSAEGSWYIVDHRIEVLGSEWFQRRT